MVPRLVNGIGQYEINDSRDDHQKDEVATCLVKKVKREKTKNVPPELKVVSEKIIKAHERGKKENEKSIVEQQRIFLVVEKLLKECVCLK